MIRKLIYFFILMTSWGLSGSVRGECDINPLFHVDIYLSVQTTFAPGDQFRLWIQENNDYPTNVIYWRFVMLDVYGQYYFWPRWEKSLDYSEIYLKAGKHMDTKILEFEWPHGAGDADGLYFWGAAFAKGDRRVGPTADSLIECDSVEFRFYEPRTPTPDPHNTPTPTPFNPPTSTPEPDHYEFPFVIAGNSEETPTGIFLQTGDMVSVNAWGEVCYYNNICEQTSVSPDGSEVPCYDQECNYQPYNPPDNHAALIGRFSNQSDYFLIGTKSAFIASNGCELILAINDGNLANNGGYFQGIIFVYPD